MRELGPSDMLGGGGQLGMAPTLCDPQAQRPSSDPALHLCPHPCTADGLCARSRPGTLGPHSGSGLRVWPGEKGAGSWSRRAQYVGSLKTVALASG